MQQTPSPPKNSKLSPNDQHLSSHIVYDSLLPITLPYSFTNAFPSFQSTFNIRTSGHCLGTLAAERLLLTPVTVNVASLTTHPKSPAYFIRIKIIENFFTAFIYSFQYGLEQCRFYTSHGLCVNLFICRSVSRSNYQPVSKIQSVTHDRRAEVDKPNFNHSLTL